MTSQTRAFGVSVGIHAMIMTGILLAGMIVPKQKVVVLDFSLGETAPVSRQPAMPASLPGGATQRPKAPVAREQTMVTPTETSETAAPLPARDIAQDAPRPSTPEQPGTAGGMPGNAAAGNGSAQEPAHDEALKAGYISANFARIRDKILRGLTYPAIARKLGRSGKVTIAFTVCRDGSVEDISVVESSGFPVLDQNAVETIRNSCPLPGPPVKTALLMPIVYRLE